MADRYNLNFESNRYLHCYCYRTHYSDQDPHLLLLHLFSCHLQMGLVAIDANYWGSYCTDNL